jgi:hypothetical protein
MGALQAVTISLHPGSAERLGALDGAEKVPSKQKADLSG